MTRYPKAGKGSKWTVRELKTIPADWKGDTLSDGEGLSGEVRVNNELASVRWKYAYKWSDKVCWFQCGTFPTVDLSEIRSRRDWAKKLLSKGINPNDKKESDRIENQKAVRATIELSESEKRQNLTVKDLYDIWLTEGVFRKDGNAALKRLMEKDALPFIGTTAVKSLTEKQIQDVYRKVIDRGTERTAVDLANSIGQMMRWAEKRQPWRSLLIDGNPAELVKVKKLVSHDYTEERDRVLSYAEIRQLRNIFESMDTAYAKASCKYDVERPLLPATQIALWICLSTLCRIGELLMAEWRHVDLDKREWFIPAENTKAHRGNKQDQVVYLSDFALKQFKALKAITGATQWLFPANDPKTHVSVKTVSKQVGDRQIKFKNRKDLKNRVNSNALELSGGAWTPHDLRRTGATMMQSLGVPLEVIDRCQNHIIAGAKVRRHYLHYEYAMEKMEAWAKLGDRLDAILANDNLTEIKVAA
jgi:integrase